MHFTRPGLVASFVVLLASVPTATEQYERLEAEARQVFLAMEQVANAQGSHVGGHAPYVYGHLVPRIFFSELSRASVSAHVLPLVESELGSTTSAEARADRISTRCGWEGLVEATRIRSLELMRHHRRHLIPWIAKDFEDGSEERVNHALFVVEKLALSEFFNEALAIFHEGGPSSRRAEAALRAIADPRAIPYLLNKDADEPLKYVEGVRAIQKGRAPAPELLPYLSSPRPELRWKALYALTGSRDPSLAPRVRELLHDRNARVRMQAMGLAFRLADDGDDTLRPELVSLLDDPHPAVRIRTAVFFAHRRDPVCLETLAELLETPHLPDWARTDLRHAQASFEGLYEHTDLNADE